MARTDIKTPPAPLESAIVKSIISYLNRIPGARAKKIHGSSYSAGWPDVLCVMNGRAIFFEVKRPAPYGTPVTKIQQAELAAWAKAGAVAGVVRSVDDVKKIMEVVMPTS